jgi:hypothetical protein
MILLKDRVPDCCFPETLAGCAINTAAGASVKGIVEAVCDGAIERVRAPEEVR